MTTPRTMFDRIWSRHAVVERDDGYTLLYIDRHLMHDGSAGCFAKLEERGLPLRRPVRSFGTPDHFVASDAAAPLLEPLRRNALQKMTANAERYGFTLFDLGDARQGIAHVVGPEQGVTQPGLTMVCGDSHTSTHGALGALAFGIGQSEVAHVMATQCLWQRRPKSMRISIDGRAPAGVSAKDLRSARLLHARRPRQGLRSQVSALHDDENPAGVRPIGVEARPRRASGALFGGRRSAHEGTAAGGG